MPHLWPEGDLDGVGELLDAREHGSTAVNTEQQLLGSIVTHVLGVVCLLGWFAGVAAC